jgi:hypothetical protein
MLDCKDLGVLDTLNHSGFLDFLLQNLMSCTLEFDMRFYNLQFQFLPFKDFQPFRAEAIMTLKVLLSATTDSSQVRFALIDKLFLYSILENECERLRDRKNKLSYLSAFGFFSVLLQLRNPRIVAYLVK